MNIVFIAQFAGSPEYGMAYGQYYLAREWVRMGHKVTIVAASFAHTRFNQPQRSTELLEEYIDGIRYVWVPTPAYMPESRLGRVVNILTFTYRARLNKLPITFADVVICSSHHPFPIFAAKSMAKHFNAKLVFEVRDLWPLTLIELGGVSRKNPFIFCMQLAEDFAYRNADCVVSTLSNSLQYMVSRGMESEKFVYIPNGIDINITEKKKVLPAGHVEQLEFFRSQGKFIVGYAGKVGLANYLDALIRALSHCEDKDICVAILGEGSHLKELVSITQNLGLKDRVIFLSSVLKSQVADFLSRIDVAFIGYRNKSIYRFGVSPTKLNDYMLSAKPVVSAINAPEDVVKLSQCGVSCPAGDPLKLSQAITYLKNVSTEERVKKGEKGRKWILENRNYRILSQRFIDSVVKIKN